MLFPLFAPHIPLLISFPIIMLCCPLLISQCETNSSRTWFWAWADSVNACNCRVNAKD